MKRRKRYVQRGKSNRYYDKKYRAKAVGRRRSKRGRWYTETRRNRSDRNKRTRL